MSTKLRHLRSSVTGKVPTANQLELGQLAINTADGKLYFKKIDNSIQDLTQQIFEGTSNVTVNNNGSISATTNGTSRVVIDDNGTVFNGPITVNSGETITLKDQDNNSYIAIQAPDNVDYSYIVKLPSSQPVDYSILSNDGNGNLAWSKIDTFAGNRVYASGETGNDENDGINLPVRTIKRACQIAASLGQRPKIPVSTGYYNAKRLLEDNRGFIQAETIGFIEWNFVNFNDHYSETICRRDLTYIFDNIKYDILLGTNYNAITSGLAYYRANSITVLNYEKIQIIGSLQVAKSEAALSIGNSEPALTRSNSAFDEISNIIETTTPSNLVFPNPTGVSANIVNAKTQLIQNKLFIQTEIVAFVNENNPLLTYNQSSCFRDVGYIVDALCYDLLYGGNSATILNSKAYFLDSTSQLGVGEKSATIAAYQRLQNIVSDIVQGILITKTPSNSLTQTISGDTGTSIESLTLSNLISIVIDVINNDGISNLPSIVYPSISWVSSNIVTATDQLSTDKLTIINTVIGFISSQYNNFIYNSLKCKRDVGLIIDAVVYDMILGGNRRSVEAGSSYLEVSEVINNQTAETIEAIKFAKRLSLAIIQNQTLGSSYTNISPYQKTYPTLSGSDAITIVTTHFDTIINIIDTGVIPTITQPNFKTIPVTVMVSAGDFEIDNPIIIPDNVSVIGDSLRSVVLRPKNANKDLFRVRNGTYLYGFTFRDGLDAQGVPVFTWDWAIAFDDPTDKSVDRTGYFGVSNDKPVITLSPYIQNCSIISFLGGNGVLVDGSKVVTPNVPINTIEVENPIDLNNGIPEQGKSMVANAFTMVSFGGTGWLLINDAYAQIVSCFQIFMLNGTYAQSGGYMSITNSATNFGLYALRSSGYSPNSFTFDRGFVASVGSYLGQSTLTTIGTNRVPVNQYVIRIYDSITNNNITSDFKQVSTVITFNAATDVNIDTDVFTIIDHGLSNGDSVYYTNEGNPNILGLFSDGLYYVLVLTTSTFRLYNDNSLAYPTNIKEISTGIHKLSLNVEEFVVSSTVSSHNFYQELTLSEGITVEPGQLVLGSTSGLVNTAYALSFDSLLNKLIVSVELSENGGSTERVFFTTESVITLINTTTVSINVTEVATNNSYYTAVSTIISTDATNQQLNFSNALLNKIHFHRPSIVNSSAHTWEYAGAGVDYNALPQNGGFGRGTAYEMYSELPGRVYSSGTNELGDFKIGDFIVAENKTGEITFKNRVSISEVSLLKLSLSDVQITQFSTDSGLGDNESGGATNSRISTQKAIRTFISNRLNNVLDKTVSTNAIPGSVVQLNAQGQINVDLIPPTRGIRTYSSQGWNSRLLLSEKVPPIQVSAGDNSSETYTSIVINFINISATVNDIITQENSTGYGIVKNTVTSGTSLTLVNTTGTFDLTNYIKINGITQSILITSIGDSIEVTDNYYLKSDSISQFLVLQSNITYNFTGITTVRGSLTGAVGTITGGPQTNSSPEYGIINLLDQESLVQGAGYTPASGIQIYYNVPLINGTGSGATATITVSNGKVDNVQLTSSGYGYLQTDVLSANANDIGGTSTSSFSINVLQVDTRLYINLTGSYLKFASSSVNPEFIADNNAITLSIPSLPAFENTSFDAQAINLGGSVDYTQSRIEFTSHTFNTGDAVTYSNNSHISIGNLTNNNVYWVKVINSTTIELYSNYSCSSEYKILFTSSSSSTHLLLKYAINATANTVTIPNHGLTTGTCIKFTAATPPTGISSNYFYYVGSVTTNCFTLHQSKIEALASINGASINEIEITSSGSGSAALQIQNVLITETINTSSTRLDNWNLLSITNIDASNIISGVIGTSRLAQTGLATNTTFLSGDSSWKYAVQNIRAASLSPISITGDFFTSSAVDYFYNSLVIDIARADELYGNLSFTNLGVASFNKSQFTVTSGETTIKSGVIDAGTLNGYAGNYYTNPLNLVGVIPISKGGTGLTTFTKGDLLYSGSANSLTQLGIGSSNSVLTSNGLIPAWSSSLTLGGTLVVSGDVSFNSTTASTTKQTGALKVAGGVGVAGVIYAGSIQNTPIGSTSASTGKFTTLTVDNDISAAGSNASITLSPTGTGTVVISPYNGSTIGKIGTLTNILGNANLNGQTVQIQPSTLTINPTSGSINNTTIGANIASTGNFTTLSTTSTTASTSTTSGSLIVAGGVGIAGAIYAGSIQNTPIGSTTASIGKFTTLTVDNATTLNAATSITANIASTSTTTGSLKVTGGVGITGDLYAYNIVASNTITATNGMILSTGTNIDQLKTFDVSVTLTTSWADTGIQYNSLATGSYFMQIYANDSAVGGGHIEAYYSATISWYAGSTQETTYDEVVLNRAASSTGSGKLYVRLLKTIGASNLKLQIAGNTMNSGVSTYTFKFRRLI